MGGATHADADAARSRSGRTRVANATGDGEAARIGAQAAYWQPLVVDRAAEASAEREAALLLLVPPGEAGCGGGGDFAARVARAHAVMPGGGGIPIAVSQGVSDRHPKLMDKQLTRFFLQ